MSGICAVPIPWRRVLICHIFKLLSLIFNYKESVALPVIMDLQIPLIVIIIFSLVS